MLKKEERFAPSLLGRKAFPALCVHSILAVTAMPGLHMRLGLGQMDLLMSVSFLSACKPVTACASSQCSLQGSNPLQGPGGPSRLYSHALQTRPSHPHTQCIPRKNIHNCLVFDTDLCLSAGNPVSAFAPRCSPAAYSSFLQRVALAVSTGRFHQPPVGPIGSKLTLQDDKWATAVEVAIGRAFGTFIVHDFADQSTLRVSPGCQVICM